MSKEKWERPKLIVLLRAKPEEAVLSWCKGAKGPGQPSTRVHEWCAGREGRCSICFHVASIT